MLATTTSLLVLEEHFLAFVALMADSGPDGPEGTFGKRISLDGISRVAVGELV